MALLLGLVIAPAFAARAVGAPDGAAAVLCGLIALMAFGAAIALLYVALRGCFGWNGTK